MSGRQKQRQTDQQQTDRQADVHTNRQASEWTGRHLLLQLFLYLYFTQHKITPVVLLSKFSHLRVGDSPSFRRDIVVIVQKGI